jgi:lipopolysaccharide/colanic/teichoic acid biosynthesis glycosyltransferase
MSRKMIIPADSSMPDAERFFLSTETDSVRDYSCRLTPTQERMKRLFDITGAIALFLLLLPLLCVIYVAIRTTSHGPAIFKQPRIGYNDQAFWCYKFRSMYTSQADLLAERQTIPGDPRITPLGRWLRRLSIDELPQLINVLRGEMSLVGPRPHAPLTKAGGVLFRDIVPHYRNRHNVRPGITGLAQISGCRGPTQEIHHLMRRVEFDLEYIRTWSLLLDIKILIITLVRELYSNHAF